MAKKNTYHQYTCRPKDSISVVLTTGRIGIFCESMTNFVLCCFQHWLD